MAAAPTTTRRITTPISSFPLNPLPTNFNPLPSCSGIYSDAVFMFDNDRNCLPSNFNQATTAFYSPGIKCPVGYTAGPGCSRSDGINSITTVTCCPVRGDIALSCVDDAATLGGVFQSLLCTWKAGPRTVLLATLSNNGQQMTTSAITLQGADGINAFGVRMVYQSTDLAALVTQTSGSLSGTTQTSTPDPGRTMADARGLSNGAKIAIGVTVPLVVLALVGLLFFIQRKRKNRVVAGHVHEFTELGSKPSTQQSHISGGYTQMGQGQYMAYGDTSKSPAQTELPASTYVSELPADMPPRI